MRLSIISILLSLFLVNCKPSAEKAIDTPLQDKNVQAPVKESGIPHTISIDFENTGLSFIDTVINNYISRLKGEFIEIASSDIETAATYDLQIKTDKYDSQSDYLSYVLSIYEYTGGAHGNSFYKTFTFDLQNKRSIGLYDVYKEFVEDKDHFYRIVGDVVMSDLTAKVEDQSWMEQGTGTDPENYENFAITDEGPVFFFPPYQVASYADGSFEVKVHWMAFQ